MRTFIDYKQQLSNHYDSSLSFPFDLTSFVILQDDQNILESIEPTKFAQQKYKFTFEHRRAVDLELQLLEAVLKTPNLKKDLKNRAQFYALSYAQFLLEDANLAGNTAEAALYQDKITRLTLPSGEPIPTTPWEPLTKLKKDLNKLAQTPWHVSQMLSWLSFINLEVRLIGTFSRLTWMSIWAFAQQNHWMDAQGFVLGHPINRAILDASTHVFNFLSVFLFVARLLAHGSVVLKHVIWRTNAEQGISRLEIAKKELYDRMSDMVNDGYWFPINLLTNYQSFWNLSDPVANALLSVALLCDTSWLVAQWYLKEVEWKSRQTAETTFEPNKLEDKALEQLMLQVLLDEQWELRYKMMFCILGALLITSSYLSVLLLATPFAASIGFSLCVLGFSMYVGAKDFAAWMRVSHGAAFKSSETELTAARNMFFTTVAKASLIPLLLVGLYTINWPAALLMTVLYAAYNHYGPAKAPSTATANEDCIEDVEPVYPAQQSNVCFC